MPTMTVRERRMALPSAPQPYNAADLGTQVASALSDPNGADVLMLNDQFFKASAQYGLADLTGLFSDELLADMYPTHLERYYYDIDTNTSDTDDPLLGLPLNNDSTVLYYNRSALESINVKCISVEEDELDAFNAGGGGVATPSEHLYCGVLMK